MSHRLRICLLLSLLILPRCLWAWSNHALGSYLALAQLPAVATAPAVPMESLEAFLAAEREGLVPLLDEQERFAREHFRKYPARPDALRFTGTEQDLRLAFLTALRLNPEIKLANAIQPEPGHDQPAEQLLAGPVFSRLVAAARRHFDVVVLDAPAIADAADGLHVAMLADLAVLALRSGSTGRKPAIAATRALRDFLPAGGEIVAVLNRHTRWRHKAPHRSGQGAPPTVRALESQ